MIYLRSHRHRRPPTPLEMRAMGEAGEELLGATQFGTAVWDRGPWAGHGSIRVISQRASNRIPAGAWWCNRLP